MSFRNHLALWGSRLGAAEAPAKEALRILLAGQAPPPAGAASAARPDVFEKCRRFTTADSARSTGAYPFFRPLDVDLGPEAVIDGRRVVMLGSSNYLGLATHPRVRAAAKAAADRYGTSASGPRLSNGTLKLHTELEERLAAFYGKEAGLVFGACYQVNVAAVSALLAQKRSVAAIDTLAHASAYDGARLAQAAGARMVRYRHDDPAALDRALAALDPGDREGGILVCTDGVFGDQGEIADLPGLVPVVEKHGARLLVGDTHGLGVIGPEGRGTGSHFGLGDRIDLVGGSFSGALASSGGFLVGDRRVLDYVQHFAHGFLFAASAAPPCVAAAMAALEVLQEERWRTPRLRESFAYVRAELRRLGFDVGKAEAAVLPIYVRDDVRTVTMWKSLLDDHGIYTIPAITPGVAPGQQALRTSYLATHERGHLDRALDAFEKVGKRLGVIR